MRRKKKPKTQYKQVPEELDRQLDVEFDDALQAMLKCIKAQEQGEIVAGIDEDTNNLED